MDVSMAQLGSDHPGSREGRLFAGAPIRRTHGNGRSKCRTSVLTHVMTDSVDQECVSRLLRSPRRGTALSVTGQGTPIPATDTIIGSATSQPKRLRSSGAILF